MIIEGLEQQQALILFYFKEEPTTIDRFVFLWTRLTFALEFEQKFKTTTIKTG
jgi:hypothetical protein